MDREESGMRLSGMFAGMAAAVAVGGVLAPPAMAAPASITPSHVTAGKVVKLTVTAPACAAPEIELSGSIIGGNVFLSHAGEPAHAFAGHVLVAASASAGTHTLSLRCSGGSYGSVHLSVGHGAPSKSGPGKQPDPAGTLVARIGWHYTSDLFTTSHFGDETIHWGACAKAGGTVIDFPKHKHLYPYEDPRAEKAGFVMATLSGPPLDPSDPFKTHMYVGDLATPHSAMITLRCMRLQNGGHSGPLVTAFTGQLPIKYVRQNIDFDPPNVLGAMPEFDLVPGRDDLRVETNLACGEVGTQTMSLTSPAFAPDANGGQTVIFTRSAASQHSIKQAEFDASVQTADVPDGTYPVTVACGSGQVGVGKILVGV
jgi:hypothetical protein